MNLIVYNKAHEDDIVKNGNLVSDMQICRDNNIYLAVGNQIFVYSLRRIADKKDYLLDIIDLTALAERSAS